MSEDQGLPETAVDQPYTRIRALIDEILGSRGTYRPDEPSWKTTEEVEFEIPVAGGTEGRTPNGLHGYSRQVPPLELQQAL